MSKLSISNHTFFSLILELICIVSFCVGDLWYPTLLSSARVYMQISLHPTNVPFGLKKLKLHSEPCDYPYYILYLCYTYIVSITKFSIVIGSPHAYLSRNRCAIMYVGVQLQVSDLNFLDTCTWIPT